MCGVVHPHEGSICAAKIWSKGRSATAAGCSCRRGAGSCCQGGHPCAGRPNPWISHKACKWRPCCSAASAECTSLATSRPADCTTDAVNRAAARPLPGGAQGSCTIAWSQLSCQQAVFMALAATAAPGPNRPACGMLASPQVATASCLSSIQKCYMLALRLSALQLPGSCRPWHAGADRKCSW